MGWATAYIAKLKMGEMVSFRPRGNSMQGKIESGRLCTVEPVADFDLLQKGDIVLCKVSDVEYLFDKGDSGKTLSNRQQSRANSIFGKCVRVEN